MAETWAPTATAWVIDATLAGRGHVGKFYGPTGRAAATSEYDNQTFATLGLTAGAAYTDSVGSGDNADTFAADIAAAATPVPERASLARLALPLGLIELVTRRPRLGAATA